MAIDEAPYSRPRILSLIGSIRPTVKTSILCSNWRLGEMIQSLIVSCDDNSPLEKPTALGAEEDDTHNF